MDNPKRTAIAVLTALSAVVLSAGAIAVGASTASASTGISGQIQCVDELGIEGVWIQASNGGSGYASLQDINGYTKNFRYSLPRGGAWTVHVGCGGSTSHWKYTPDGNTTTTRTYQSWLCVTPDDGVPWPSNNNYCGED